MSGDPLAGATPELLLKTASDVVRKVQKKSTFFDPQREAVFPHFDMNELVLGRVLGRGAFSAVREVKKIDLNRSGRGAMIEKNKVHQTSGESDREDEAYMRAFSRDFVSGRCVKGEDARYAIKILSQECKENNQLFLQGSVDLAVESKFLAVLEHPHIIKMRGMASVGPFEGDFFIVLDRLYDTLEQRLKKWKKTERQAKSVIGAMTGGKKKKNALGLEQMLTAYDLATAMKYMHSKNIIYRDLKPENIGFDVRGDVKIFDFGLSKELHKKDQDAEGLYNLTGFTGSLRYMAPEVAMGKPYNLSADVFSFGILFWSIMALEVPFAEYSTKMHDQLVVRKGYRPAKHKSWRKEWFQLMESCWSTNPHKRLNYTQITKFLSKESDALRDGVEGGSPVDLDVSVRGLRNAEK